MRTGTFSNQVSSWPLLDILSIETAQHALWYEVSVIAPGTVSPSLVRAAAGRKGQGQLANHFVATGKLPVERVAVIRALIANAHAAPKPPAANSTSPLDLAELLAKLASLRDQGALTDAEYESKKAEILRRL
jgi:hypothetical protein